MKEIETRIAKLEKHAEGQARRIAALESLISILVATHAINSHGDDDSPGIEASLLFKAAYRELQAQAAQLHSFFPCDSPIIFLIQKEWPEQSGNIVQPDSNLFGRLFLPCFVSVRHETSLGTCLKCQVKTVQDTELYEVSGGEEGIRTLDTR